MDEPGELPDVGGRKVARRDAVAQDVLEQQVEFAHVIRQLREGSGGEDGRGVSFSDTGFLTYRLTFTDGSSGIFRSSITPVPEPASAGLIAAAGLAALAWLKRRSGWLAS